MKPTLLSVELELAIEHYRQAYFAWKEAKARDERDWATYRALQAKESAAKALFVNEGTVGSCEAFKKTVLEAEAVYRRVSTSNTDDLVAKSRDARARFWELMERELTPFVDR